MNQCKAEPVADARDRQNTSMADQANGRWIMSPAALRDDLRQVFPPVEDDRFAELAKQADAVRALA